MKDFFKKKRPSKVKQTKSATSNANKQKGGGKSFLNRFRKKTTQNVSKPVLSKSTQSKPKVVSRSNVANNTNYNLQTWYSLNGRIGRIQFLAYSMIWGVVASILFVAAMITGLQVETLADSVATNSLSITSLVLLLLIIPVWIFTVIILPRRRLHDSGKPAWWLFLYFVPLANLYLLYLLYFKGGDAGVNSYGLPSTPYNKVELVLAILLPICSVAGVGAVAVLSASVLSGMQQFDMAQIDINQPEGVDPNAMANAPAVEYDMPQDEATATDENTNEELSPETDAQIQAALDNAANSTNDSSEQVTYDEFLREARTKIYVDKTQKDVAPAQTDQSADSKVFADGQSADQPEPDPDVEPITSN